MESTLSEFAQQQEKQQQNQIKIIPSIWSSNTSRQRLIPLTKEIIIAMMDFNGSQSSTSLSDQKPFYNTFSITSLVREEVQNILQELCVSDQFIRKEEIDQLIERCLKEKITIIHDDESKTTTTGASESEDTNQEIEVTVEMLNENDKNKLIVENFQILEQRITNLEERISAMLQTIPKVRQLQSKKFKINTEVIRNELKQFMDKLDFCQIVGITEKKDKVEQHGDMLNKYDDLYYEQRQYEFNILNYKKSSGTMKLMDERPCNNPIMSWIRPVNIDFPGPKFKPKMRPTFLCSE